MKPVLRAAAIGIVTFCVGCAAPSSRPLPSWNDGPTRSAILEFVERVTEPGGAEFVPEAERIAVFDNDGTLWVEQPLYVQGVFALDRVRTLAPEHPEWKTTQPFQAVLEGDTKAALAGGQHSLVEIVMATHAGMTTGDFEAIVNAWLATARHPRYHQLYTDCVYLPMLELLAYLRANGFETWIVSGGGVEFMRTWTDAVYGVPPQQVIGSSIEVRFEMREGVPVLVRLPKIAFVDDKDGKPIAIHRQIGRRPIAAFGNSDGDLEMLQWTNAGSGARLELIVHHTDAVREYAYDRDSSIGRLDAALDVARERDWVVVDMAHDWKTIFPPRAAP